MNHPAWKLYNEWANCTGHNPSSPGWNDEYGWPNILPPSTHIAEFLQWIGAELAEGYHGYEVKVSLELEFVGKRED